MTFSKAKLILFWVWLLIALGIAVAAAIINNVSVSVAVLVIAAVDMLYGAVFLRCPACGKILLRAMRPWKKDCTCPGCKVNIRLV